MDVFINLPSPLLYIITYYNPRAIFILPKSDLVRYDWFKLIKINFSLIYEKTICTNEEIMKVYFDCCKSKPKMICSYDYTIVRSSKGTLKGCGNNNVGQMGMDRISNITMLREIKGIDKKVAEIACGNWHTMIRLQDGRLMATGFNKYGALGAGDNIHRSTFTEIFIGKILKVACGSHHTIIRSEDGTLMGSGMNHQGQLGLGDYKDRYSFTEIVDLPKNIFEVVCGGGHTIAMLTDGTTMASGRNIEGQLGLGDTLNRNKFTKIPSAKNIAKVKCGFFHTIIQLTDGTLMSSGFNRQGQLGLGDYNHRNIFTTMACPKNIDFVICGFYHTIIKLSNGKLMGCGKNYKGQLGLGDNKNRSNFSEMDLKNVKEIACGMSHSVVKLTDGTLMSSGSNKLGQLSLGLYPSKTNKFLLIKELSGAPSCVIL